MTEPIYKGPQDDPNGPAIHLTCADGGDPNAASEIVLHDLPGGVFVEFYFGPGYLGQRCFQMNLSEEQTERLREFSRRRWPDPPPEAVKAPAQWMRQAARALLAYLDQQTPTPRVNEIEVTGELINLMEAVRRALSRSPEAPHQAEAVKADPGAPSSPVTPGELDAIQEVIDIAAKADASTNYHAEVIDAARAVLADLRAATPQPTGADTASRAASHKVSCFSKLGGRCTCYDPDASGFAIAAQAPIHASGSEGADPGALEGVGGWLELHPQPEDQTTTEWRLWARDRIGWLEQMVAHLKRTMRLLKPTSALEEENSSLRAKLQAASLPQEGAQAVDLSGLDDEDGAPTEPPGDAMGNPAHYEGEA